MKKKTKDILKELRNVWQKGGKLMPFEPGTKIKVGDFTSGSGKHYRKKENGEWEFLYETTDYTEKKIKKSPIKKIDVYEVRFLDRAQQ